MGSEETTQKLPKALVDWEERLTALEKKFIERGYDTRPAFEALDQRLTTLEAKVASLRNARATTSGTRNLEFKHGLYWIVNDTVPFCPHCYEGKPHEQRHLQLGGNPGQYWCSKCKNHFQDSTIKNEVFDEPFGIVVRDDESY